MNKGWCCNATGAIIAKLTYSTTAFMADGYGYTYVQSDARTVQLRSSPFRSSLLRFFNFIHVLNK